MSFQHLWTSLAIIGVLIAASDAARAQDGARRKARLFGRFENNLKRGEADRFPDMAEPVKAPGAPLVKPAPTDHTETLDELIQRCIEVTSARRLTTGVHTPWQIVHGILALRWDFMLNKPNQREEVNAIEWMASNPMHDGLPLWLSTRYGGRGHPFTKPYAFEGHPTQFMGYMTMANIPPNYEFQTNTRKVTIKDIINDAKLEVRAGPEITWTLWALAHYEDSESQWLNSAGEPWSIERLVKLQVDEPVTSGACGGTHGLFALCYARNMYLSTGRPLRGVWLEADQKIKRYVLETKMLQNGDGSFSTHYFEGPGYSPNFSERVVSSGHQLEWLMVALPQSKLKEEWVQRGLTCMARDLLDNHATPSDCGPLYHALHGLVIYRQRTNPAYLVPVPRPQDTSLPRITLKSYPIGTGNRPTAVAAKATTPETKTASTQDAKPAQKADGDNSDVSRGTPATATPNVSAPTGPVIAQPAIATPAAEPPPAATGDAAPAKTPASTEPVPVEAQRSTVQDGPQVSQPKVSQPRVRISTEVKQIRIKPATAGDTIPEPSAND